MNKDNIVNGLISIGWVLDTTQEETTLHNGSKAVIVTSTIYKLYDLAAGEYLGKYALNSEDKLLHFFLRVPMSKKDIIAKYNIPEHMNVVRHVVKGSSVDVFFESARYSSHRAMSRLDFERYKELTA